MQTRPPSSDAAEEFDQGYASANAPSVDLDPRIGSFSEAIGLLHPEQGRGQAVVIDHAQVL